MKHLLIYLTFCLSNGYAQTNSLNPHRVNEILPTLGKNDANGKFSTKKSLASENFNVHYYRCRWKTTPDVRYIEGSVTAYFTTTTEASQITFDLSDKLIADSTLSSGGLKNFEHVSNALKINLDATLPPGAIDSVTIYYHGVPDNLGFGTFTNSFHNGVPVMWTLSEPYGSSDWWPCRNGLNDKADSIDVYITSPEMYTAVSNGIRQSIDDDAGWRTTHWKHRYPIAPYLVGIAVTDFTEFENHIDVSGKNLLMQTFCYPENLTVFRDNTPKVLEALQYYTDIVGEYPFIDEKYGHTQVGFGGGMEHQTNTFLNWPDETLMAHELAHQWFGNKITCGSWQHVWLNEGFADHMATMFMEHKYPASALYLRKVTVDQITAIPNGSVYVDDTTSVNRIFLNRLSYKKGSYLIFMLRKILGDDIFFKAIKEYLNDTKLAYGFALTKDLQHHLEKTSGRNLDYFFNEWFYGQGYPSYKIEWWQQSPTAIGMRVSQKTSDSSVKYFQLPVDIRIKNNSQEKNVTINPEYNGQVFYFENAIMTDTLEIDPDIWLVTRNNQAVKINAPTDLQQVTLFPNPISQKFYIRLNGFADPVVNISMFSLEGKLLRKESWKLNGSIQKEVNAGSLPNGVYLIRITSASGYSTVRKIEKR